MKIAIIVRRLNVSGGTQRAAILLAQELKNRGHQVALHTFTYSREQCYPELMQGLTVVEADAKLMERLREAGGRSGPVAFIRTLRYQNRAARDLARRIPADTDILNPHDQVAERVAAYFKRKVRRTPSVWTLNDVSTKRTTLLKAQALDPAIGASLIKRIAYWCIDQYEFLAFVRYQDVIAVLDARDQRWAQEQFRGKDIVVVCNGLSIEEFPYVPHAGVRGKVVHLLVVAILLPHRRFEDAIRATAILRAAGLDARLSIIGKPADRTYAEKLRALAVEEGISDQVTFKGTVSHEELLNAYRESDVFIFPCHLQSWGLAVFEAMASGLPVIVSETAGASEVLTDGENAIIVPPFAPESIADAVQKLSDPVLYNAISMAGRKFVEENISWSRYADQLLSLFEKAHIRYRQ